MAGIQVATGELVGGTGKKTVTTTTRYYVQQETYKGNWLTLQPGYDSSDNGQKDAFAHVAYCRKRMPSKYRVVRRVISEEVVEE